MAGLSYMVGSLWVEGSFWGFRVLSFLFSGFRPCVFVGGGGGVKPPAWLPCSSHGCLGGPPSMFLNETQELYGLS